MQTLQEPIEKTVKSEYRIIRLDRERITDVEKLYAAVYGKIPPTNYFTKKFNTAYTGTEYVGLIAYNNEGLPVAYYGVIPCFIEWNGRKILAAQSTDTMTDPGHRFKGMFVELSLKTFDLCRQLGIRLIYGFPNQNSYHGAVSKLGWQLTETLTAFTLNVKTLPLQRIAARSKFLQSIYNVYRHQLLRKRTHPESPVANSVIAEGFAGVSRDTDYWNYKSFSPSKVIVIDKAKIWISFKGEMRIGDMEGVDEMNFSRVIKKLKTIAAWAGIRQIQFHCSHSISLHRLFEMHFQTQPSYPALFQDLGAPMPCEKIIR